MLVFLVQFINVWWQTILSIGRVGIKVKVRVTWDLCYLA